MDKITVINKVELYENDFNEVWSYYPRKEGRKIANKRYVKLRATYSKEEILQATAKYIEEVKGKEKQYIKQGQSFFKDRILDYLEKVESKEIDFTIELSLYDQMLKELRTMKYSDYLNTEHWKHFKSEVIRFYGASCQVCSSSDNLNVHHKTYDNRGRETFNDVVLLCRECHSKIHGK